MANPNPRPGPGRPKGSRNKRTLALLARERMTGGQVPPRSMTEPECLLFKMRWWLGRFFSEQEKQNPDLALMERCLDKAQEAAVCAAPYHHARLSAMVVGATTVQKITIVGGSSRRDFPELAAEIPLTDESGRPTVIEAEPNGDADPDDIAEPTGPAAA